MKSNEGPKIVAARNNEGKPELTWLFSWPYAIKEVVKPFISGKEEYGLYNYKLGAPYSESINSAMRHTLAWWNGEDFDKKTLEKTGQEVNHLAFAIWNLLRVLDETYNPGPGTKDDRPEGMVRELIDRYLSGFESVVDDTVVIHTKV